MQTKKPGNIVFKLLITLALTALGGWLFYFNWLQRPIHYRTYTFSLEESSRLRLFGRAQYAHGLHAWFQNDPETAAEFFRQLRKGRCLGQKLMDSIFHKLTWLLH